MQKSEVNTKCGFIGLVGPTNSGKSTLMNALIGHKVSIVSPKVQTTYHGIHGMKTQGEEQMIFTDTPGFQRHSDSVAKMLNRVADRHASESDVLVWVFDASNPRFMDQILRLSDKIKKLKPKDHSFLALNKVDKRRKEELLPVLQQLHDLELFEEIIPISAKKKDGIKQLLQAVSKKIPQGTKLYPDETVTDRNPKFIASEMIREKLYHFLHQEVPYASRVEVEDWVEHDTKKLPTIHAVIRVDSPSKRPILIGKKGETLKKVGTEARKEIEAFLGHQVCLKIHVDVEEQWKTDKRIVSSYLELG